MAARVGFGSGGRLSLMRERNPISVIRNDGPRDCRLRSSAGLRFTPLRDTLAMHYRTASYAAVVGLHPSTFSFLLPRVKLRATAQRALSRFVLCCTAGLFRQCNTNLFARCLILRFSPGMVPVFSTDSKLCACTTRHASVYFLAEIPAAQLGKGQGFAPPRCIPSRVPQALAETVPVSTPFGFSGVASFRSRAVRP